MRDGHGRSLKDEEAGSSVGVLLKVDAKHSAVAFSADINRS